MKQIKLLGVAFIAMLSLTGILAAASTATLPNLLPEAGTGANHILASFTSKESKFGNGVESVKSVKDEGTLEATAEKLGSFDILFLESKNALGTTCTGLGDTTAGSILALGTYHIRAFTENSTLLTAAIFLLLPVHFECGSILVLVTGCVAGAMTPENTLTKTLTVTLAENGTSLNNLIITVLNEGNTAGEACQLLSRTGEGVTKLSDEVTTETISGFRRNGTGAELEDIEVMRL